MCLLGCVFLFVWMIVGGFSVCACMFACEGLLFVWCVCVCVVCVAVCWLCGFVDSVNIVCA